MMRQKLVYAACVAVTMALVSASYGAVVKVSDFEGSLGGWYTDSWTAGTVSLSTTGATSGTQAMQVTGPGGWQQLTKVDVKPEMAALANKGVKIMADVTAFEADMTTTWMQVGMVLNCEGDNDNGANNNLGWNDLGLQDLPRDGQPHTLTWVLPDAVTAKIAGADDKIGWFEFLLISNVDGASVAKLYVDNVQVSYEPPTKNVVIGDFEGGKLDNWSKAWEETPVVLANATKGVTSGSSSLSVTTTGGYWCLQWNAPTVPVTLVGNKLQFDLTMIASEWPVGVWTKVADKIALNSNGPSGWKEYTTTTAVDKLTQQSTSLDWGRWWDAAPDVVKTYTVDISDYDVTGATWFQINISVQGGNGTGNFYFDNVQLVSPMPTGKSTDIVIGNFEQSMDGWAVGGGADVRYNDHNGVTLDKYSLDVYTPTGAWASVLTMNLLDPNNAAALKAFRTNTKLSADITHLVADWPVDKIPPWNGIHLAVNCGGDGWNLWQELGYRAGWQQSNGDRTDTAVWDYSPLLSQIKFDNLQWFSLEIVVNANSDQYTGWVWFYIDNIKLTGGGVAQNPTPASGAKDVDFLTKLSWTPGAFAKSHNVYLGKTAGSVASAKENSDPAVTFAKVDGTTFDPGALAFDTLYFWRVDPVNDVNPDSPWTGVVWSFTTANFITVDNFESYTNDSPNRVFQTWIDGYGFSKDEFFPEDNPGNGSDAGVGHDIWSPGSTHQTIMETTTVHSGSQSMPLYYDNKSAGYSEATHTWAQPQDWTLNSFNALKFYVYGKTDNVADPMYITLEDSAGKAATVPFGNAAMMTTESWAEVSILLTSFTDVNMASIKTMAIGVGSKTAVSKAAGMLLIDDIRIGFKPLGLVAHYKLDGNLDDSSGNGHNGTLAGDPNYPAKYVAGPTGHGQAMLFDGTDGHQYVSIGNFNPSAATGQLTLALWVKWDGPSGSWQGLMGKRNAGDWVSSIMMWYFELEKDVWDLRFVQPGSGINSGKQLPIGQWTHVAATFDGTTAKVYVDDTVALEGNFFFGEDKAAPMQFGASVDGGWNPFNGAIDEVYIYDTALTDAEIKALASTK